MAWSLIATGSEFVESIEGVNSELVGRRLVIEVNSYVHDAHLIGTVRSEG